MCYTTRMTQTMNYANDGYSFLFYGRNGIHVYEASYSMNDQWVVYSLKTSEFEYDESFVNGGNNSR